MKDTLARASLPVLAVLIAAWLVLPARGGADDPDHRKLRLRGKLSDSVSGEMLTDCAVKVPRMGTTRTNSEGLYKLTFRGDFGLYKVIARNSRRHYPRVSWAWIDRPTGHRNLGQLPKGHGTGFNMEFFDHVFRWLGESGTRRWVEEPQIEVWNATLDCLEQASESDPCLRFRRFRAGGSAAPGSYLDRMREIAKKQTPRYTGRALKGNRVSVIRPRLRGDFDDSELHRPGAITIVRVRVEGTYSWASMRWHQPGVMTSAVIEINSEHSWSRYVMSHELAHTLGFLHPEGYDAVPLPSIMGPVNRSGPTSADVLHGRILYDRPPGSRHPDQDPRPEELVAALRMSTPVETLIVR